MEEELVKLGYVFHEDSRKYGEGIISNNAHPNRLRDSLSTYKELYIHKNEFHMGDIFNLPEQFSEALAYAKEAIESSIWNNDYKVGDWVVVMNYKQCGEGNAIIEPNLVTQLLSKDSGYKTIGMIDQEADFIVKQPNENNYCNIRKSHIIRKATPEEIAEATKPKETILILGDKGITVKITKEKIIAENKEIDYYALKGLVKTVEQISGGKISDWKVTISEIQRAIKIGCSFFSIQELKQVIEEYDKLNK